MPAINSFLEMPAVKSALLLEKLFEGVQCLTRNQPDRMNCVVRLENLNMYGSRHEANKKRHFSFLRVSKVKTRRSIQMLFGRTGLACNQILQRRIGPKLGRRHCTFTSGISIYHLEQPA